MDPVQRGKGLNFLDPLPRNESSSLRERLIAPRQSKDHAFEQTSVGYIREWVPIQNSFEIGCETQSSRNLAQASKEDSGAIDVAARTQVFWVARIANDGSGRNAAQLK